MGEKQTGARQFIAKYMNWIVLAGFTLVSLVVTLPFILNPLNTLTSPIDGDAGYSSILFEAIKREGLNPFVDGRVESIASPDGMAVNTGVNRVSFFSTLILWIGTLVSNAVFIHSLLAIIGTILSAYITYLFVRKVTNSVAPAILSGLLLGFFPLMIAMLFSAYPYTHMWLYTVVIWGFWYLSVQKPAPIKFILVFLMTFMALFWTPYFTYHVLLIAGVSTAILAFIYTKKYGLLLTAKYIVPALLSLGIFVVLYYFIGKSSDYSEIPVRTIEEIYQQSAHPLMYLLPGVFSVFGTEAYKFLVDIVPRASYTAIQLGITTVIVASLSGLVFVRSFKYGPKLKNAVLICAGVVFVTFMFSLAPTITVLGLTIPTPNYIIAEFAPALRAGQRLAMPLMAALGILFGIGLYVLLSKVPRKYRYITIFIVAVVMFLELASFPPSRHTILQSSPLYNELSRQEKGLAAVYLNNSLVSNPGQKICYPQFEHKMPLINDCAMQRNPYEFNTPTKTLATIIKQPMCEQLKTLYNKNVKYLIVAKSNNGDVRSCLSDKNYYTPLMADELTEIYKIHERN